MTILDSPAADTLPANEHALWFDDVSRILAVTRTTPGLPLPFISPDRASFYFLAIVRDDDAREAVALAERILSYALRVTFTPGVAPAGFAHDILQAVLPSGLMVTITSRGQHDDINARIAARLETLHAEVAAMAPRGAAA